MKKRFPAAVLPLLLSAAALVGCSSSGGTGGTGGGGGGGGQPAGQPPKVTATPTPTSGTQLAELPLVAFLKDADGDRTIDRATDLLTQDCMHRLGFAGWKTDTTLPVGKPVETAGDYGYLDEAQAAQYGFRSAAALKGKPTDGPRMQPGELAALTGSDGAGNAAPGNVPQGGCGGEAFRTIRAGLDKPAGSVYDDLMGDSYQRTASDSRVVDGIRAWSDCMKQKGFTYSTPKALSVEAWGPQVTQREIDTAKADVACTKQTNLPGIAFAVQSAIQQQQIEQHQQQLKAEKDFKAGQVRKAAEILRSKGQ